MTSLYSSLMPLIVSIMIAFAITTMCYGQSSVKYTLINTSSFTQGCSGLCKCPVVSSKSVNGSFDWVEAKQSNLIHNLNFTVTFHNNTSVFYYGSGIYQIDEDGNQAVKLNLIENATGQPVILTGMSPLDITPPALLFDVSTHTDCYNKWLTIGATPVPKRQS